MALKFENGRAAALSEGFCRYKQVRNDISLVFVVSSSYQLYDSLHQKEHHYCPIQVLSTMANVGRSSFTMLHELKNATGQVMALNTTKVVRVNEKTRKSIELPSGFREFYSNLTKGTVLDSLIPLMKPQNILPITSTVCWSHTDKYYHTNQCAYIMLCLDAIMSASRRPQYAGLLPEDIAKLKMKTMKMLYLGETKPPDELEIFVWTEPDSAHLTVNCIIEKEGKSVFHFQSSFRHNEDSKL